MLDFLRGQKESIRRLCGGLELELEFYHKAPLEIDVGCFGLDDAGKLSDERYFIFYNQTQSPEGGILLHRGAATGAVRFHLRLDQLPPHIAKLSFTASIDGTRTMQELTKGHVCLFRGQEETARYSYDGSQFRAERAIVICELYRKGDDWRFNAVGRGTFWRYRGGTNARRAAGFQSSARFPASAGLCSVPQPAGRRPVFGAEHRLLTPNPCLRPHGQPGPAMPRGHRIFNQPI